MGRVRGQKRIGTIVVPLNLVLLLNRVIWSKDNQRRRIIKKARFTETQILRVLKEVEEDRHVKDV
ncbi:hypothetical protein SAMN02982996_01660 [Lonsdalea quercina]|uniref:Uncharacterized protein n=1 Tax=Lonsdalea quercina TaxID=71657 RepID=A0A1H4B6K2_9GAMM|nr:hypothetical protein SAMN02982996_01660 [Lonsdalea quercina]